MRFDIHTHTEEYSMDSQLPLRQILLSAKEIGLGGVCITDHETQALYPKAEALSKEFELLVIVGMEYTCREGHLLVFGAPNLKRSQMPLPHALKEIKSHGGIAIAAHPFRWDSPDMEDAIREYASELDGVEAFNGGATATENLRAYDFAVENQLPILGGSDAHHEARLGRFITEFLVPLKNESDFIRTIIRAKETKRSIKKQKKEPENIIVSARKGLRHIPAYSHEKQQHDRVSPPNVNSIKEILNMPAGRNRFSV